MAATVPAAPTVTVESLAATEVTFSWTAADGGSPITGYIIRLSSGGVVVDEAQQITTYGRAYMLVPNTSYEVSVAAINAVGTGAFTKVPFTTKPTTVDRQYGTTRYDTAVKVAQKAFPGTGGDAAFLASGLGFPDALAAAAAAGATGAPVLLTDPRALPAAVGKELGALAPQYLVVAGGPASVSEAVAQTAAQHATVDAFRLAGQNRFGTAADVATLWDSSDVVYLASGMNFPDALSGAAAAGAVGAPVLLTAKDTLPPETKAALARLRPSRIVVLGGTGVVSAAVVSKATAATGVTTKATRLAGASRYDTAVAISKATFPEPGVPAVYVASGASFADALAGAAAAGYRGGPVLLTDGKSAPATVLKEIQRLRPGQIVVLGGPSVVSDTVKAQLLKAATS
ncbi:MAG: cell wall-binding repeat-containing protein [Microbacterium sp.]|jgi:putative cell wall-binding protein|nr:cell wall-binding repeat-containing protein [Microbacterium sp.]